MAILRVASTVAFLGVAMSACYLTMRDGAAAERPAQSPDNELSATLEAAKPVKSSALASSSVSKRAPPEMLVPTGLVEFWKDEKVVGFPRCAFQMVDGHPTWNWDFGSGIQGEADETQARLIKRLTELGFKKYESPSEQFPLAYRRDVKGRDETVWLKFRGSFVGGRVPTVGFDMKWTIRSAALQPAPTLAEVFIAMPTLRPPKDGAQAIPESAIGELLAEHVVSVALHGPSRIVYSLEIELAPTAGGARPPCVARLVEALKKEEFAELEIKLLPYEGVRIMDMARRPPRTTAQCQATVFDRKGAFHISLFVQTGEQP